MSAPGFRRIGFVRGFRWLPAAAELLFSAFAPMAGLAALWLLVSMLAVVPLVGQVALMLMTPALTAGAIGAFAEISAGRRPSPGSLFAAFGHAATRNRLLAIGAFGLGGSVLALAIVAAWLGGQVTPEQLQAAQQSPEALARLLEQLQWGPLLLVAAAMVALVMAAMYFAIPLVIFERIGTGAALALSLRAVLANWLAFLGLGLATIGLVVAVGFVFGLLTLVLGLALGTAGQVVVQSLFMLAAMLIQVLLAGTQWVAFRDVFGRSDEEPDRTDDDQLLA